jgi:5-bromo-4-chloroindolyl phosphate hydrolysis protein
LYYGFDPFVDKISDEIDGKVFDKVNKNIAFAVRNVQTLKDLNTKISNISVEQKLSKVIEIYERKISDIKNSPLEFDRYRKFMSVYLEELVNIVKDYTEYVNEDGLKDKLISLLDLIVEGIKRKERDVNSSDMESLEIDIEVLREELKRG